MTIENRPRRSPDRAEDAPDAPRGRPVRASLLGGGGLAALALAMVVAAAAIPGGPTPRAAEPARGRFRREPASVTAVAFAPDGRTLALGRVDGGLGFRDLDRGGNREVEAGPCPPPGVGSLAYSPDGRTLASAGPGPALRLWDAATREPLATLAGHSAPVRSVAFSPDGKTLASGALDGQIKLWDLATGAERAGPAGHSGEIRGLAYSPDGKTLASGSFDGTIRLWDLAEDRLASALRGEGGRRVYGLAYSPDGKTLAFGLGASLAGEKGMVVLWDLAARREGVRILGQTSFATVAFSPDGKTLASGGGDRVVALWDVETGRERASLVGHEGFIDSITFSPDGRLLATGGRDSLVGLFDLRPDAKGAHRL